MGLLDAGEIYPLFLNLTGRVCAATEMTVIMGTFDFDSNSKLDEQEYTMANPNPNPNPNLNPNPKPNWMNRNTL